MRYYVVAGEASGDLHGSNLLKQLKQFDKDAEFRAWGGDLMREAGATLVKHYSEMSFMGFWEVLVNLPSILRNIKECISEIEKYNPDVVILIDYPGFNLRVAEAIKAKGIKVYYYISPQVWAWHTSRVKKIRKVVDKMLVILPFEREFYNKYKFDVDFVGHPLLDAVAGYPVSEDFRKENQLPDKPLIALLPGSRKQEIERMLPVMLSVNEKFPNYRFVIAGVSHQPREFYKKFAATHPDVQVVYDQTYDLLRNAEAAVVTSGTATLETALFRVPQVVCYRGSRFSYFIGKNVIKVKYISLVNLILDEEVVKELIQYDFNDESLERELRKILQPERQEVIRQKYLKLIELLGDTGASERAARLIWESLKIQEQHPERQER